MTFQQNIQIFLSLVAIIFQLYTLECKSLLSFKDHALTGTEMESWRNENGMKLSFRHTEPNGQLDRQDFNPHKKFGSRWVDNGESTPFHAGKPRAHTIPFLSPQCPDLFVLIVIIQSEFI